MSDSQLKSMRRTKAYQKQQHTLRKNDYILQDRLQTEIFCWSKLCGLKQYQPLAKSIVICINNRHTKLTLVYLAHSFYSALVSFMGSQAYAEVSRIFLYYYSSHCFLFFLQKLHHVVRQTNDSYWTHELIKLFNRIKVLLWKHLHNILRWQLTVIYKNIIS